MSRNVTKIYAPIKNELVPKWETSWSLRMIHTLANYCCKSLAAKVHWFSFTLTVRNLLKYIECHEMSRKWQGYFNRLSQMLLPDIQPTGVQKSYGGSCNLPRLTAATLYWLYWESTHNRWPQLTSFTLSAVGACQTWNHCQSAVIEQTDWRGSPPAWQRCDLMHH